MAFWRLHYHLVWATYKREPIIDEKREKVIYGVLYGKAKQHGLIIHAIGSTADHIHVIVSVPPTMALSDCMRHFKGASSYAVNHRLTSDTVFKWQDGYGVLTLSTHSLPTLIAYATNQKQHHRDGITIAACEQMGNDEDGPAIQHYQN